MNNLLKHDIEEMNNFMNENITGFKVDSLESANWCFKNISRLNGIIEENNSLVDREIEKLEAWREKENRNLQNSIDHFTGLLLEYYRDLKLKNPKAKLKTPYGKVTSRKVNKWHYDVEEIVKWAKKNDRELIKITETLNKAELKAKYADGIDYSTGEIIKGVTITQEESISIKAE